VPTVRFNVEQCLTAPVERVEAALVDATWYQAVTASTSVWAPELLDVEELGGAKMGLQVRYRFRGKLNAAASRVVDPSRLTWVEVSTLDRELHAIELRVVPDHYGDLLRFTGSVVLRPDGDSTGRTLDGEVKVRVPLVGGRVEGAVVSGLREHAEVEEQVFGAFVARHR